MDYAGFLKMAEAEDAAGQNGPQLFLHEASFLQVPLVDLIVQGALRVFEKDIDLEECGTELLLGLAEVLHESHHVVCVAELTLLDFNRVQGPLILLLVVETQLTQQILLLSRTMLEVGQMFRRDVLNHLIFAHSCIELLPSCRTA